MVVVFLYGSLMSPKNLREQGLMREPDRFEVASLEGFDFFFSPSINLKRQPDEVVYGVTTELTPQECETLFSQKRFADYREETVTVKTKAGLRIPAACHFAPQLKVVPPKQDYIDRLVEITKSYGFPSWYIERLAKSVMN